MSFGQRSWYLKMGQGYLALATHMRNLLFVLRNLCFQSSLLVQMVHDGVFQLHVVCNIHIHAAVTNQRSTCHY